VLPHVYAVELPVDFESRLLAVEGAQHHALRSAFPDREQPRFAAVDGDQGLGAELADEVDGCRHCRAGGEAQHQPCNRMDMPHRES